MALDGLYRKAEELSRGPAGAGHGPGGSSGAGDGPGGPGRQLDGQVALFQGSIRNNEQNVARIRES